MFTAPGAGELRHRIALQYPTVSASNSFGDATVTWTVSTTRWAKIEPLTGRELWQAQQVQADVTHTVTLRYTAGVGPTWQAVYQTRVFNIMAVLDPGERRVWHQLLCKEQQ